MPSLLSIWATAPLLHNNSLGLYNNDPSVDGRLEAFDDAIRKLLWPQKRLESSSYNGATPERLRRDHGLIWRTTQETDLSIDAKRAPYLARPLIADLYTVRGLHWLRQARPLWLPSLLCLLGGFVVLLVSNYRYRKLWGYLFLALAALSAIASWGGANLPPPTHR